MRCAPGDRRRHQAYGRLRSAPDQRSNRVHQSSDSKVRSTDASGIAHFWASTAEQHHLGRPPSRAL